MGNFQRLPLAEKVFILTGILTLFSVPFLATGGFYLWLIIKIVYLIGILLIIRQKV